MMFKLLEIREDKIQCIDQREIQKKGGKYAKYPTSAIVAELLCEANAEHVIDTTYGQGRFYVIDRPKLLIGIDPVIREWIVKPDIFLPMEVWKAIPVLEKIKVYVDCVVCDPPWGKQFHYRDLYNYVVKPEIVIKYALKLAEVVESEYFLLHYKQPLDLGLEVVKVIEFTPIARYLNQREPITYFILYKL